MTNLVSDIIPVSKAIELLQCSRSSLFRIEKRGLLTALPKRSYYLSQIQKLMLDKSWKLPVGRRAKGKATTTA